MHSRILKHGYSCTWIFIYISSHVVTCGIVTNCIHPFQFLVLILSIRAQNIFKKSKMQIISFEGIGKSCWTSDNVRSFSKWKRSSWEPCSPGEVKWGQEPGARRALCRWHRAGPGAPHLCGAALRNVPRSGPSLRYHCRCKTVKNTIKWVFNVPKVTTGNFWQFDGCWKMVISGTAAPWFRHWQWIISSVANSRGRNPCFICHSTEEIRKCRRQ